jgi:peroxiredoxin
MKIETANVISAPAAPPLYVSRWFNAPRPITLADLRGRVVMIHAFQMLCPGCVVTGVPQAKRIAEAFNPAAVVVIGLHTVFEHHEVMTPAALEVFIHEFRLPFPIAVDQPGPDRIPLTMSAYQMQGTPTTVLIDKMGRLRHVRFGVESDLVLGAAIGRLEAEVL